MSDKPISELSDDEIRVRYPKVMVSELRAMSKADSQRVMAVVAPDFGKRFAEAIAPAMKHINLDQIVLSPETRERLNGTIKALADSPAMQAHATAQAAAMRALLPEQPTSPLLGPAEDADSDGPRLMASHTFVRPEVDLLRQVVEEQRLTREAVSLQGEALRAMADAQALEFAETASRSRVSLRWTRVGALAAVEAVAVTAVFALAGPLDLERWPTIATAVGLALPPLVAWFRLPSLPDLRRQQ